MSLKNLNAIKTPKNLLSKLLNKRIRYLFKEFENNFEVKHRFAVAVSGGPDSLALAFLTKVFSIKYNLNCKYFIIDHKLRKGSTNEAKKVKKILSKTMPLNNEGWNKLNSRWIFFFIFLAILNEFVWRTQSEEFWVNFKVWGMLPITIIFTAMQLPLINRYKL